MPRHHRLFRLTLAGSAGLVACSGPPGLGSTDIDATVTASSTFVYVVRSSISEERLVAASLRAVVAAFGRDEAATVYLVEGTAAGTAPLATFGQIEARNRYARSAEEASRVVSTGETITDALTATPSPEPGRADDLARTATTAVTRAEAQSEDRRPLVVIITTALPPGDPPETIDLPDPQTGRGAEVVIVGAGDFGGLEENVDPAISDAAERYATAVCTAIERSPERSCRVEPTLDAVPSREASA